jgi:arginyl-tRNA--protein-N-Asp/Glu arginylyltransferase
MKAWNGAIVPFRREKQWPKSFESWDPIAICFDPRKTMMKTKTKRKQREIQRQTTRRLSLEDWKNNNNKKKNESSNLIMITIVDVVAEGISL